MVLIVPVLAGLVGGVLVARIGRMAVRTAYRARQAGTPTFRGPAAASSCGCGR